jgi:hypothetical protein
VVNGKFKGHGKQIRQGVCAIDLKNKICGRILSRMMRNKHKQKDDHVPTIIIEYLNSVESVSPESARDNHPWYDYVSNLPSFLQNCEGFTRIQTDLKAMMTQEKTPDSDYQEPIPNLEPVCCDECLAWI